MKYALIGCGRVAPSHIKAARENKLDIVALCDIDLQKAEAFAKNNGLKSIALFTDYRKMIEEIKPDFVAIAAISGVHGEISEYCALHGVNFLVEKPMAMSISEANKVIDAAEKTGVVAGVCHQNRFNIAVQELKRALDCGRFGTLSHGSINVRWCREREYYSQDLWRGKYETDGGTLMNQCIHGIDLLRWLMGGDAVSVYGLTRNRKHPYIEAEDVGVAVINFRSGAVATVEGTVNSLGDLEETLCVFGENGTVRLGGMGANAVDVWRFKDEAAADDDIRFIEEKAPNVYGNGHISLYLDFINAVKEGGTPYVDLKAGKDALEIVLAIYKSQKTGEKVELPLTDFSSADMVL